MTCGETRVGEVWVREPARAREMEARTSLRSRSDRGRICIFGDPPTQGLQGLAYAPGAAAQESPPLCRYCRAKPAHKFGDVSMWLQIVWLQFAGVRGPVGVIWV